MFEAFMIYLYISFGNILGTMSGITVGILGAYFVAAFALGMGWALEESVQLKYDNINNYLSTWSSLLKVKIGMTFVVISFVLNAMYPTHEDIKYIIGGAVAWNAAEWVATSDEAKRIPTNVLKAMESFLGDIDGSVITESVEKVTDAAASTIDSAGKAVDKVSEVIIDKVGE